MKIKHEGDKGRLICEADGWVGITYCYRDVPFSDGVGLAPDVLVGVCDVCGEVLAFPPQSTPAIVAARQRATQALEANLPASYVATLDAAAVRIDAQANTEFRKRLLMFYLLRYARGDEAMPELVNLATLSERASSRGPNRRLSFKLSKMAADRLDIVLEHTGLSKTQLIKALIGKISADIVKPTKPPHLAELVALCEVMNA